MAIGTTRNGSQKKGAHVRKMTVTAEPGGYPNYTFPQSLVQSVY